MRMKAYQSLINFLFPVFVTINATHLLTRTHAYLLDPYTQAIGEWDVTLRRRDKQLIDSIVFPPYLCRKSITSTQNSGNDKNIRNRHKNNVIPCKLNLHPNGTFMLTTTYPSFQSSSKHKQINDNSITTSNDNHDEIIIERQALKGYWNLKPNPYCITDRHYDELQLTSFPKVRYQSSMKRQQQQQQTLILDQTTENDEQVIFELSCRIYGRYSSNSIRKLLHYPMGRNASRMTHGKLSVFKSTAIIPIQEEQLTMSLQQSHYERTIKSVMTNMSNRLRFTTNYDGSRRNSRRVVCATFCAKPLGLKM